MRRKTPVERRCSSKTPALGGSGPARQLMSPTQHNRHNVLLERTTSRRALNKAWLNVKSRVSHSKDTEARAAAASFSEDVDRSIAALQRQLRSGGFIFEPQRGMLKRKRANPGEPRKEPRPIVVAPVLSRIVQRAILDTCQCEEKKIVCRLGALPTVIATPTSVGGLPGRGVREAISLISQEIAGGARWFVRSDIKRFFQTIPKQQIKGFLLKNIAEGLFVDLFMRALHTELANESEVRDLIHLFQSARSAFHRVLHYRPYAQTSFWPNLTSPSMNEVSGQFVTSTISSYLGEIANRSQRLGGTRKRF